MESEMQITAAVNPLLMHRMTNERKWRIPCAGPGATGRPAAHLGAQEAHTEKALVSLS